MTCFVGHDPIYHGSASFQVLHPAAVAAPEVVAAAPAATATPLTAMTPSSPAGSTPAWAAPPTAPTRAASTRMLLLPAVGLVLIVLAVGLRLRQTTARGRL